MKKFILLLILLIPLILFGQTEKERQEIIAKTNVEYLQKIAGKFDKEFKENKAKALKIAQEKGWLLKEDKDGVFIELIGVTDDGKPIYYQTTNVDAAVSTRTNTLHNGGSLGLNIEGQNMTAHVWDAGLARTTHQEYDGAGGNNRFSIGDGTSTLHYHSAHVTGTIIASGFDADAKGMAPQADAVGYEWNNDESEATTAASSGMLLSNHSYGYIATDIPDDWFGQYGSDGVAWDDIMYNAPYYLMVVAAGNDGNDDTSNGAPLDGNSAYDKLSGTSTAKNNLVVANAQDANIAGDELVSVTINSSSSEGPTDDYRIKPDIAGNGTGLYSTYEDADDSYNSISGTSMASPNVTGTLLLLQQHYNNIYSNFMKAATLKGLALHTADDAGDAGPDAIFGWGLLNAKKAANTISDNGQGTIIDERSLSNGDSYFIDVVANGNEDLMASISWTDEAGTANGGTNSSTPALVNDLDVRITEGASTYYPWRLTGITTNSNAGDNIVDPYERVDVTNPVCGTTYRITVTHKGTLSSAQDYSLIITGIKQATVDAGIVNVFPQGGSCSYSNNTPIDIEVGNFGSNTLNNVSVVYEIRKSDNSLVGNGNYTIGSIAACNSDISTVYADMSINGEVYTIDVDISVTGDENSNNNSYSGDFGAVRVDLTTPGDSYSQGFEAGSLSEIGWSQEDVNGDGGQGVWYIYTDNGLAHSGDKFVTCFAGAASSQSNDWLYSPCLSLKAGQDYDLSYWIRDFNNKIEDISVHIGTSASSVAMTTTIEASFDPTDAFVEHTPTTFNVASDGVYYLGWHSAQMTDSYAPFMDDINITNSSPVVLPQVTTDAVTSITGTSADGAGNVTDEGSSAVTERGVVYSTSINPTTADNKVTSGSGAGAFTGVSMTPLTSSTTYYVRAYAVNSSGTSYGSNESFTTLSGPPSISSVDINDFFKDKGATITISGTDLGSVTATDIGGISGTLGANTSTSLTATFPAGVYANNTLTVTTASGSDTYTMSLQTRNLIPVGGGTDFHASIQDALDGLYAWYETTSFDAGDLPGAKTIDVYAGTYTEQIVPNSALTPTTTNRLLIQNHTGESPIIDASGENYGFNLSTVDYVTLKGFQVHSADIDNIYASGSNVNIKYNKTYGSVGGSGINISAGTSSILTNNLSYLNSHYGILVNSSSNTVKNNSLADNGANVPEQLDQQVYYEDFEPNSDDWVGDGTWSLFSDASIHVSPTHSIGVNDISDVHVWKTNPVDITGYTNLEVSTYVRTLNTMDAQDDFVAEYSFDNSNWSNIVTLDGVSASNSAFQKYTVTGINPGANTTLYIRFYFIITKRNNGDDPTVEYWLVDDVEVRGDILASKQGAGLYVQSGSDNVLQNNIIVAKSGDDGYYALKADVAVAASSDYNTYYSINTAIFDYLGTQDNIGPNEANQLTSNPLFVGGGDYHLQSITGSYTNSKAPIWPPDAATGGVWSDDASDSPSLEGNGDDYSNEPEDNGDVINRGVYGNTVQASKGPPLPCTYPFTQATTFSATPSTNSIDLSWTRGDGNEVLVVARETSAVDTDPADGMNYTANATFSSGNEIGTGNFAVYEGTGTSVNVTGLSSGITYHFAIYEFTNTDYCYLTPGLTGNSTTTLASPLITGVNPGSFFADKGKQLTIDGTDLASVSSVTLGGISGTINTNTDTEITVTFPAASYSNNTLTVTTAGGSDNETVTVNTRNIIPVGGGTDFHVSIQDALDGLYAWYGTTSFDAGDLPGSKTIDVYNGTYAEVVTPNANLLTTASENLIIRNHAGNAPEVNATGLANGFYVGLLDYVQIIGFSVYGADDENIYTAGANTIISLNKCYSSPTGTGIMLNDADGSSVTNNLVYDNNQFGVRSIKSDNIEIDNNTLVDNGNEAKGPPLPGLYEPAQLYVESGTTVSVENNIFFALAGSHVFCLKTESGTTINSDYNTYYKNGNAHIVNYNGTMYVDIAGWTGNGVGTNDLETNPDFVDAATDDFHIHSTNDSYAGGLWPPTAETGGVWTVDATNSPALDAGNPADLFANEPQGGTAVNQGAYGNTAQASKSISVDITWTGATDNDWQTAGNWSPAQVPTSEDNVIIPDVSAGSNTYPLINDGATTAECNDFTIDVAANIIIAVNGQMTVNGIMTNSNGLAGLTVQSDNTGTGSLIVNNTGVQGTVERYLSHTNGEAGQWHFVGSPITEAPLSLFNTNNFYEYIETNDDWWTGIDYFGTSGWSVPTGNLNPATGYLYYFYETTLSYQGELNYNAAGYNATVSYNEHIGSGGDAPNGLPYTSFDGWNLVSNPYQSALDWLQVNKSNDVDMNIYYYDDLADNYVYYIDNGDGSGNGTNGGSQFIPLGQGFFVKSSDNVDGGILSIPNAARTHNTQDFWKGTKEPVNQLKLKLADGDFSDEALIRFREGANEMYEGNFDAYKRFSWNENVPQIYSFEITDSTQFAINTLNTQASKSIPLGYKVPATGDYTMQILEADYSDFDYVYLEDKSVDEYIDISTLSEFSFTTSELSNDNRFVIHFGINQAPTIVNSIENQDVLEDSPFTLNVQNTFQDNDIQDSYTCSASMADGGVLPAWLSFNSETVTFEGTPENSDVGTIALKLTATDSYGAETDELFNISVINTNDAPELVNPIPDQAIYTGEIWSFTFDENVFTDIDINDELNYSAQYDNLDWLSFNSLTRTFTAQPQLANVGEYSINVVATDLAGYTATDEFNLSVSTALAVSSAGKPALILYPNPANDKVYVTLAGYKGNYRLKIYSVNGKLVYYSQLNSEFTQTIETDAQVSGIYFVEIITDSGMLMSQKLIIE